MTLAQQLPLLVAAVFVVGTPHGALDGRIGRAMLEPRLGGAWFGWFVGAYLLLAAAVVGAWVIAPAATLVGFLGLAAVHFGSHDSPSGRPIAVAARGSLPVVIPAAAHPQELATLFGWLAGDGGAAFVPMIGGSGLAVWIVTALATLVIEPRWRSRAELLGLSAVFVAAPPLVAFALYFAAVHTPRALRSSKRFDESWWQLLVEALPFSLAAVALAALGYMLLRAELSPEPALVRTTFWWLAALTVPHFLLGVISSRALRPSPRLRASAPPPHPSRRAAAPLAR